MAVVFLSTDSCDMSVVEPIDARWETAAVGDGGGARLEEDFMDERAGRFIKDDARF